MASFALLDAVNTRGIRTTADVAAALGVDEGQAGRELREARRDGLVDQETDLSVSLSDDERRFWYLTPEGRAEWDRLNELSSK